MFRLRHLAIAGVLLLTTRVHAADVVTQFFDDLAAGRAEAIVSRMGARAASEVDLPVLKLLAQTVTQRLGPVERITTTGLRNSWTPQGKLSERTVSISFENGTAVFRVATRNARLVMFDLQSETLVGWLQVPDETEYYQALAKRSLNEILTGDARAAREMWHHALKELISLEQLREMKQLIDARLGRVTALTELSVKNTAGSAPGLRIDFEIAAEKDTTTGHILIQFAGLKGHIVGFNVSLPKASMVD